MRTQDQPAPRKENRVPGFPVSLGAFNARPLAQEETVGNREAVDGVPGILNFLFISGYSYLSSTKWVTSGDRKDKTTNNKKLIPGKSTAWGYSLGFYETSLLGQRPKAKGPHQWLTDGCRLRFNH